MYVEKIADLFLEMAIYLNSFNTKNFKNVLNSGHFLTRAAAIFSVQLFLNSCSTPTKIEALPPIPAEPPGYVRVPHPEGLDQGDLMAIFTDKDAPSKESFEKCDADFQTLLSKTTSKDELTTGARELVRLSPEKMHWCFYGKILLMEDKLKAAQYIDEKQKTVLDAYSFLTPVSRAFFVEYRDSRYLRWAVNRYRRLSETVFYRKMEMTQQLNEELVAPANPLGADRPPVEKPQGVLEKYGLVPQSDVNVPSIGNYAAPSELETLDETATSAPMMVDSGVPGKPALQQRVPATIMQVETVPSVEVLQPKQEAAPLVSPKPDPIN